MMAAARRNFEREYLAQLLQTTSGNVARAARVAQRFLPYLALKHDRVPVE